MLIKTIKLVSVIAFAATILVISSWLVLKQIITAQAENEAHSIIASAYKNVTPETADDKIKAITTEIFNTFEQQDPATISIYKLRQYLTNKRLPAFLRLQEGVFEVLLKKGLCDNTARLLSFVLKQEGFSSIQWDMRTSRGGHAALLVSLPDKRNVYVDPLFGVVAVDNNGKLIHPDKAKKLVQSGRSLKKVFAPLGENSKYKFYKNFAMVSMNRADKPLTIETIIPEFQNALILGDINKNAQDVQSASAKHNMGTIWGYAGHKYNRHWVRTLKTDKPVRVVITLTSNVESGIITSDPKPKINGKQMIWNLKAGDEIKFHDGLAKISFIRLNSYIDIDQIAFYKP